VCSYTCIQVPGAHAQPKFIVKEAISYAVLKEAISNAVQKTEESLQQSIDTFRAGAAISETLRGILAYNQPVGASTTRGASSSIVQGGRAKSDNLLEQEMQLALDLREDLHDFGGKSDWLLAVTVRQHHDTYDTEGARVEAVCVGMARDYRMYRVEADQDIKVTVTNLSATSPLFFKSVYMDEEAEEDEDDLAKPVQKLVFLEVCLFLCGVDMRRERERAGESERQRENTCACMRVCACVCMSLVVPVRKSVSMFACVCYCERWCRFCES